MAVEPVSPPPAPAEADWPRRRVALILDGHGWASRAVMASLGRGGWEVLAPAGTKCARSRYCSGTVTLPDYREDAEAWVSTVRQVLGSRDVALAVPGEDASLELLYDTVGLLGETRVLGGDRDTVRLVLDKARTLEAARAHGFATPRCAAAETVEDAVAGARELGFPCVIKPRRSYARDGNRLRSARLAYAFSAADVRRSVEEMLAMGFQMPLVQEWVPGRSFGVAAVVRRGRVLAYGVREAYSQIPIRGGSAVWRATVDPDGPGVHDALRLMCAVGLEGMGDVQFHIAADGTPTLMEIGSRTYGWLPLTIAAGADLPIIAARALEGEEPELTIRARPGLHMRWPRGEIARVAEALSPGVQLPPGASRRDVLRQLWPLWGPNVLYDGWNTGDRRWLVRR